MSLFQNIYGVLFRPDISFKYLGVNYNSGFLLQSIVILLLTGIIKENADVNAVLAYCITWILSASLLFAFAYVFKLKAREYGKFITLLAFSNLPLIFYAATTLISEFNSSLATIIHIVILIWSFNLSVIAISESCSISRFKVTLLYILPPLTIVFLVGKLIIDFVSSISLKI